MPVGNIVGFAIAVGVFQNNDASLRTIVIFVRPARRVVQILQRPDATAIVKRKRKRLHDVGFGCKRLNVEPVLDSHLRNRLVRIQEFDRSVLSVRKMDRGCRKNEQKEQSESHDESSDVRMMEVMRSMVAKVEKTFG
jgi:hypothetical protein